MLSSSASLESAAGTSLMLRREEREWFLLDGTVLCVIRKI
jgi:hypothetical protein